MDVQTDAVARASATEKPRRTRKHAPLYQLPADFADNAKTKSMADLERLYGVTGNVIRRWFEETGSARVCGRGIRPAVPADFREMAAKLTKADLQKHYRRNWKCIGSWLEEAGAHPAKQPLGGNALGKPVPADFRSVAPTMTIRGMERHYHVHGATIARWCRVTGIAPGKAKSGYTRPSAPQSSAVPAVELSNAAQAAQFLRASRMKHIVYRCDILTPEERAKLPNHGRGLWYINGRGAVPEAEMIAIAEAKGFDRRAWARI